MGIYKDLNDYEVMYLVEENDDNAKELLLEKYEPVIKKIAINYKDDAKKYGLELEDLVQEGYLGLYNALKTYDSNQGVLFYTYASISIKSKILNCLREKNAMKQKALNDSVSLNKKLGNSEDEVLMDILEDKNVISPHLSLEMTEFEKTIRYFLLSLSFLQSCIFELELNGFSNQDIQKLLDVSSKTVANCLFNIRKKLKNYLNEMVSNEV